MNFNLQLIRTFRILLFPFSLLYLLVIWCRNLLYDKKIFASSSFNIPIICVGNIAAGGTGKSPMVEWLLREFSSEYQMATLSRGYKRKTKGYALATETTTALEIGDEPMQFHLKFPQVAVAVGEERIVAIPLLLHDRPNTELIVLDDAFQHRAIKAGLNIILTDYNNLYPRDWYLPTGDLRDEKRSARRADIIIVTKCPLTLSKDEAAAVKKELQPLPHQQVFFAGIQYGSPYHILNRETRFFMPDMEVLLVTGIANPKPLKQFLAQEVASYDELVYSDHHIFSIDDMKDIRRNFEALTGTNKFILTTEKDAVRLLKFSDQLNDLPIYVLPIEMQFLYEEAERFKTIIGTFNRKYLS